eukprot:TRINITY_DN16887_c0_g1_i1.p1 TRINITY_DN16887_c0_g1~~TRINITY_DN16887_c0_g1_i1.p1  ORF type:complete len:81 (-),score=10.73 TRINITY_DN16887_c0_g1_i1:50-292(-)
MSDLKDDDFDFDLDAMLDSACDELDQELNKKRSSNHNHPSHQKARIVHSNSFSILIHFFLPLLVKHQIQMQVTMPHQLRQ